MAQAPSARRKIIIGPTYCIIDETAGANVWQFRLNQHRSYNHEQMVQRLFANLQNESCVRFIEYWCLNPLLDQHKMEMNQKISYLFDTTTKGYDDGDDEYQNGSDVIVNTDDLIHNIRQMNYVNPQTQTQKTTQHEQRAIMNQLKKHLFNLCMCIWFNHPKNNEISNNSNNHNNSNSNNIHNNNNNNNNNNRRNNNKNNGAREQKESKTEENNSNSMMKGALIGGVVGVGLVVAAPVVLGVAGFSSTGIVGGSLAAAWQSTIGNVAAGSLFATLQSTGAAGIAASTQAAIVGAGAAVGGVAGKIRNEKNNHDDRKEGEQ